MSATRGTERYRRCIEYLEAKYNPNVTDEEYQRKLSEYAAFDQASKDLSRYYAGAVQGGQEEGEDAEDVGDDDYSESDSDDDYEMDGFLVDSDEEEDDDEEETVTNGKS